MIFCCCWYDHYSWKYSAYLGKVYGMMTEAIVNVLKKEYTSYL